MGLCGKKTDEFQVQANSGSTSGSSQSSSGKIALKKEITLFHGVAIIVGIIVGSGIFVSPVGILQNVKSVGLSFVLWVVCGIYNALGAVCYAELGTSIPESGGEYVYIKRAFGEIPAFICLWINFLLICPVGIAAMSLMFSIYLLQPMFPDCEIPEWGTRLLAAVIVYRIMNENEEIENLAQADGSGMTNASTAKTVKLQKRIKLHHAIALIMGTVIGSGIFVSPVGILKHSHSVGFSFILWVICGLYNLLGAICYAELGTSIPESGGEYIYVKRAFGDLPAFIVLWINFLLVCPVGVAALGTMFALYIIKPIYPDCEPPDTSIKFIGASLICLLIMVNCINVKWATKVQVVITISKLLALGTIICIGLYYIGRGETESFKDSFEDSDYSAGAIALSFYSGFWAYSGWSYLNFLVDEIVNPNRNLPLAIGISMTLVIVFYLVANVAYLAVLSPREMLLSPAVAVTFADSTMGVVRWIMPILIAISVCGTMNGTALGFSRLFYVGAKNGQLPSVISMINFKRFTPVPSLLVIMVLSLLFQTSSDIFYLIEMEGFGFATVLVMVFAAHVYLRFKEPNLPRPIKVPIVLPIFLCLVSIVIVILTFIQKPNESFLALGLVAVGVVLYLIGVKWKSKPKFVKEKMGKLTILVQKILQVVMPDNPEQLDWD